MVLNIEATFEGKLTCALKNDMRNLANFQRSKLQGLKIGTLMTSFCLKLKMYELNTYRGVMCHNSKK